MRGVVVAAFSAIMVVSAAWAADNTREQIQRSKLATAYVVAREGQASATATCVDKAGIFIASRSALRDLGKSAKLKLVVNPMQEDRRELLATLLRIDNEASLAILQAERKPDEQFAFLPLGDDGRLFETMQVTAFGYPAAKRPAGRDAAGPELNVRVGRIAALRRQKDALQGILVDVALENGISGGPVIDETGALIGMVDTGEGVTRANLVTPVSAIRLALARPEVLFQPPQIAAAKKHEPAEFRVKLVPLLSTIRDASVELQLTTEGQAPRTFKATAEDDNQFVVKAVVMPPPTRREPVWLRGTLHFAQGSLVGAVEDQAIALDGRSLRLADVRSIRWDEPTKVVGREGEEVQGNPKKPEKLRVDMGDYVLAIDGRYVRRLELQPARASEAPVRYLLTVRQANAELARLEGLLAIGDSKAAARQVSFVAYKGSKQTLELRDTITDMVLAGGGRYLLAHLGKARKVAVYDVNQAKIVRQLALSSDHAFIAGGMDVFIVACPTDNVIERWSLATFEKETSRSMPVVGVVKSVAMGYASQGPLLIHRADSTDALARCTFEFFNPRTFEKVNFQPFSNHSSSYRDALHIRVAGTGDVFGLWATSHSPQGMETLQLTGETVRVAYQHESAGHIAPNYDGSAVLTGFAGLCSPTLDRKGGRDRNRVPLVPSTHPRFYVAVPAEPGAQFNLGSRPFAGMQAAVHAIGVEKRLVELPPLELGAATENYSWSANDFTLDKRVFYVPQANQLISVPYTSDRIIVQCVNLREMLDKEGADYFYIVSVPPRTFVRGQVWRYAIEAVSRRPGVEYELSSGPQGMVIDGAGNVEWSVPADFKDAVVNVILVAKNSAGQSTYDSFKIIAR